MVPLGQTMVELQPPHLAAGDAKGVGGTGEILSSQRPMGKQNVGPKGQLDVSQNQNVFKHVGESQLMSVISSMLGQWSQSVQQSGEAHNKIDRAKAQVAFNDFDKCGTKARPTHTTLTAMC